MIDCEHSPFGFPRPARSRSSMSRRLSLLIAVCWLSSAVLAVLRAAPAQSSPPSLPSSPPEARAVVNRYCVGCHNGRARTAGLELDALDLDKVARDGEVWEN